MNAETSRQPDDLVHMWTLPKGLTREKALQHFLERVKPKTYTFERFDYNAARGVARTI